MKEVVSGATTSGAKKIFKIEHSTALHCIQAKFTGTVSALTISVEGSLDGESFFELAAHTLTAAEISAKVAMFEIINKLSEYIRINLTTYTGTGPVTVYYTPATSAMLQVD